MWIDLRTPRSRTRYGRLEVRAAARGAALTAPCPAVVAADPAIAAGLDNPDRDPLRPGGPPPFGRYRLSQVVSTRGLAAEARAEYGPAALAFEPLDGDAATAESYGRLLLLVHGGELGADGRLRPTTGGVRLTDADIGALADLVRGLPPHEVTLELRPLFFLWALWRPRPSQTGARPVPPPVPGVWGIPPPRPARPRQGDDPDTDSRRDSASPLERDAQGSPFQAGGGAFGGGGATASWDDARIGGAVAAGAALGATAMEPPAPGDRVEDPGTAY